MKIEKGTFPWLLLYLPLVVAALGAAVYLKISGTGNDPLGPGFFYFGGAFMGWWVFLTVKSDVIPTRTGGLIDRESAPIIFWSWNALLGIMGVFLVFVA